MILKFFLLSALPLLGLAAPQSSFVPAAAAAIHVHNHGKDTATPRGTIAKINGVNTYVTLPRGRFQRNTAVVLLTDVFGLPLVENRLLVDQWADAGFATYAPDYLNGDAITETGDFPTWILRHGEAQTTPPLLAVLRGLRGRGVTKLAVTGYCFGGLYTIRLAQNNTITVGSMSHPSLLTIPDDFELLLQRSHVPIEINNAEEDGTLTPALAREIDEVLGGGAYRPGYVRREFTGVGHGFAVSADPADPVQVAAKQGAFDTTLKFFRAHL